MLVAGTLSAQQQQGWSVTQNGYAPWQADDKRLHFQTGFVAGWMLHAALDGFHVRRPWLWCLLAGVAVGFAKEIYDRHHGGSPELMDALNTTAGFAAPGLVIRIRF